MIRLDNIAKQHGHQILFLEASATVHRGEHVGLVGPNGAGKSTIFRMVMKEEEPDEGQVSVDRGVTLGYFSQDVGEMKGQSVVGAEMRILITRDRPVPAGGAQPGREERTVRMRLLPDGAESPAHDEHGVLCGAGRCGAIVELSLAQAALGVEPGDRVGLSVQVLRDEGGLPVEVDRLPRYGDLELLVPDRAFERAHWQV